LGGSLHQGLLPGPSCPYHFEATMHACTIKSYTERSNFMLQGFQALSHICFSPD
jgi:hypothetical protein